MRDGSAARDYADDVEARWDDDGTIWRVPSKGKKGKASEMKADKMKADGMKVETPKKGKKKGSGVAYFNKCTGKGQAQMGRPSSSRTAKARKRVGSFYGLLRVDVTGNKFVASGQTT